MRSNLRYLIIVFLFLLLGGGGGITAHAQSANDIKAKIEDRNVQIEQLEREIREQEQNLRVVGAEKQTLKGTIQTLDLSRNKISTDISLTQHRIGATDQEIGEIEAEIQDKETKVQNNRQAVAETLRTINRLESDSLIETILAHDNLSEVWDQVETLQRFQIVMRDDVTRLTVLKSELEGEKDKSEDKRSELSGFKQELSGKKQVLDQNRNEKNQLLKVTENKEAVYQQLLREKEAAREKFEQELQDLEAQLKFTLDPSLIPTSGQGILAWPISNPRITQYFGNTPFAKSGAYSGSGHNGIDLGVSQGTPVRSSLGGTIAGGGNTDAVRGCYSYGKWVLVKHNNGLSTLYAHLSVISVNAGQTVGTGDIIGFSGNTGYSTGPHLHYSVYLSDAVQIVRLGDIKKVTNCGPARIPVAPFEAYMNPLDYLRNGDSYR